MKKIIFITILLIAFNCCFAQLNVSIQGNPPFVCRGYSVVLTADVIGGTQPYSYHWSNNSTDSLITVSPTVLNSTYSVTVTDNNSNSASAITTIFIDSLTIDSVQFIYHQDTVELGDIYYHGGGPIISWNWCGFGYIVIDTIQPCCVIIVDDWGCMDTLCTNISPNTINEYLSNNTISIFPNPSTDKISITNPPNSTIEVLNTNGLIVKSIFSNNKTTSVDLKDLSSGVYIVRVKTDKEIATKKIIKE